jgi:hypothetical protein
MSKRQLLCLLGVWVAIFLFLGLPSMWHRILAVITGLVIVCVSYTLPGTHSTTSKTNSTSGMGSAGSTDGSEMGVGTGVGMGVKTGTGVNLNDNLGPENYKNTFVENK